MPWAMSAKLSFPEKNTFSISGDGGFLFSAMELETAVREHLHFIHFIWVDGSYNMVKEQELMKYKQHFGVEFGRIDIIKFAESFGAKGFLVNYIINFDQTMSYALKQTGPMLIEIPIDYSDNPRLFESIDKHFGH